MCFVFQKCLLSPNTVAEIINFSLLKNTPHKNPNKQTNKKHIEGGSIYFGSQFRKRQAWSTDSIAIDLVMKQSIKQQEDVAEQHHPGYRGQEAEKNNEGPGQDVPFKDMPPRDLLSPTSPHCLMKPG